MDWILPEAVPFEHFYDKHDVEEVRALVYCCWEVVERYKGQRNWTAAAGLLDRLLSSSFGTMISEFELHSRLRLADICSMFPQLYRTGLEQLKRVWTLIGAGCTTELDYFRLESLKIKANIEWNLYETSKDAVDWRATVRTVREALNLCTDSNPNLFAWNVYFTLLYIEFTRWNSPLSETETMLSRLRRSLASAQQRRPPRMQPSAPSPSLDGSIPQGIFICESVVSAQQALCQLQQHQLQGFTYFLAECDNLLGQMDAQVSFGQELTRFILLLRFAADFQTLQFRKATACATQLNADDPLKPLLLLHCARYTGSTRSMPTLQADFLNSVTQQQERPHTQRSIRRFSDAELRFSELIRTAQLLNAEKCLKTYRDSLLEIGPHCESYVLEQLRPRYLTMTGILNLAAGLSTIALDRFSMVSSQLPDPCEIDLHDIKSVIKYHTALAQAQLGPPKEPLFSPISNLPAPYLALAAYASLKLELPQESLQEVLLQCHSINASLGCLYFEIWSRIRNPPLLRSALSLASSCGYVEGEYCATKATLQQLPKEESGLGSLAHILQRSVSQLEEYKQRIGSLFEAL